MTLLYAASSLHSLKPPLSLPKASEGVPGSRGYPLEFGSHLVDIYTPPQIFTRFQTRAGPCRAVIRAWGGASYSKNIPVIRALIPRITARTRNLGATFYPPRGHISLLEEFRHFWGFGRGFWPWFLARGLSNYVGNKKSLYRDPLRDTYVSPFIMVMGEKGSLLHRVDTTFLSHLSFTLQFRHFTHRFPTPGKVSF